MERETVRCPLNEHAAWSDSCQRSLKDVVLPSVGRRENHDSSCKSIAPETSTFHSHAQSPPLVCYRLEYVVLDRYTVIAWSWSHAKDDCTSNNGVTLISSSARLPMGKPLATLRVKTGVLSLMQTRSSRGRCKHMIIVRSVEKCQAIYPVMLV